MNKKIKYINNKPHHIDTIVVSAQHDECIDQKTLYNDILNHVIKHTVLESL